jgi:hypothetical protein
LRELQVAFGSRPARHGLPADLTGHAVRRVRHDEAVRGVDRRGDGGTASDVAAFLDGLFGGALLPPEYLARMTEPTGRLDEYRARGLGVVRFDFRTGNVAYGHHGGVASCSTCREYP